MLGRIIGAAIGKKMAGRYDGTRGMILGALAPTIARRAFGPLGLAIGGGYLAKKYYDGRKARRARASAEI
ncbi:hypothetical protein [Sphingosinicella rhizophila]|uniref:Uncharacterized protein n=1 Tax=Sphingosinicella rhizophila TaxID=3050082 RepID=A0ABU3Q6A2_9SPHN|nr:hypothetical protein [Sphingosinicella sp. GR2756]MDT9598942.1 hypothetical protein [Sphingosinicella sp. GR2756]